MALESNLEYQDEDGALILKNSDNSGGRLLGFYDTLQEACQKFGPDNDLGIEIHIRAWSITGNPR